MWKYLFKKKEILSSWNFVNFPKFIFFQFFCIFTVSVQETFSESKTFDMLSRAKVAFRQFWEFFLKIYFNNNWELFCWGIGAKNVRIFLKNVSTGLSKLQFTCPVEHAEENVVFWKKNYFGTNFWSWAEKLLFRAINFRYGCQNWNLHVQSSFFSFWQTNFWWEEFIFLCTFLELWPKVFGRATKTAFQESRGTPREIFFR